MIPVQWRQDFIISKVKEHGYCSVAEIGVQQGSIATKVIPACPGITYIMVEQYVPPQLYAHIERMDGCKRDSYNAWVTTVPVALLRMSSLDAAPLIADDSLDLVFIDACHNTSCCAADIKAWLPKITSGGIISGHDYFPDHLADERGNVAKAVRDIFGPDYELVREPTPTIVDGGNHVWWRQC